MNVSAKATWERLSATRLGRWVFGRIVCFRAPYFATIRPRFRKLESGLCEIGLRKRRAVLNHLGTVHAIAMCNVAELAAGLTAEVTLPSSYRWIPKGMQVSYLKPARTDLVATARCDAVTDTDERTTLDVTVDVRDTAEIIVFQAVICMHVSKRR